jgi:hypothetical protein
MGVFIELKYRTQLQKRGKEVLSLCSYIGGNVRVFGVQVLAKTFARVRVV